MQSKPRALVDTGALLALLDQSDRWHAACAQALGGLRLPLLTSAAVFTELFHLVGDRSHEVDAAWRLLRSGAVHLMTVESDELAELEALMKKYGDRPMDFADATLVLLASREGVHTVFAVDHSDFETYRIDGRRKFRVVPSKP